MLDTHPSDPSRHRPGTVAHDGHCSWHGPFSCPQPPVISFQDRSGAWQSGCRRAVDELPARGWISTPGSSTRSDMQNISVVWARIQRHAGQPFRTKTGLPFTYQVPGNYLRVDRTNRSLLRTSFATALEAMPADGPGDINDRQGAAYTWAILMDERIRRCDW